MLLTPAEWDAVLLSIKVSAVAVAGTFPFGIVLAHYFARHRPPVSLIAESLIQLPLVLPPVVTGIFLLVLFGPHGVIGSALESSIGWSPAFTWVGAALAAAVVAFPLMVQAMRATFAQIEREWEEACYVYGGSRWDALRHVTLPLAARGIAGATILAFARALGEFGATIVVAGNIPGQTRTIPLAIFTRLNQIGGEQSAFRLVAISVLLSVLSVAIHLALTRRLYDPRT